jgi:hypothetical protein
MKSARSVLESLLRTAIAFKNDTAPFSQRLPLEFLVELLKFPLPTQCVLPVLEPLCLEYAREKFSQILS